MENKGQQTEDKTQKVKDPTDLGISNCVAYIPSPSPYQLLKTLKYAWKCGKLKATDRKTKTQKVKDLCICNYTPSPSHYQLLQTLNMLENVGTRWENTDKNRIKEDKNSVNPDQ